MQKTLTQIQGDKARGAMSTIRTIGRDMPATRTSRESKRLVSLLMAVLAGIDAMAERHRSRNALSALNDEQLKDIGLSRADAFRETSRPFWR
jgi:uncharacterized protein YjiS (DUF1127 family)